MKYITMRSLILFLGTVVIVHSAVISPKHHENFPLIKNLINGPNVQDTPQVTVQKVDCAHGHEHVHHPGAGTEEKSFVHTVEQHFDGNYNPTSVVGPSGSITQKQYSQSTAQHYGIYDFVKNNPVIVDPVVFGNIVQGSGVVSIPSQKKSVVGPSGTITQEKYPQFFTYGKSNEIYSIVRNNGVNGKPVVVPYKNPVPVDVDVRQGSNFVSTPSEKTSIIGPSGSITQEQYAQSTSVKSDDYYGIAKINPVTGKPVVVQYKKPVSVNVDLSQVYSNTPSEKTSVVGPSGSITQEKYTQSTSVKSDDFYGIADINPVTGKPVVVQYKKPVSVHVDISQVYGNTPSEKTSVVGPSGSITHEKYTQSTSNSADDFYGIAKINPITGKPVVVQYKKPVSVNVDLSQVYGNTPSEKTSIVGPSGSITQEKYAQSTSVNADDFYGIAKINPVTEKPVVVVQYKKPVSVNVDLSQVYGNTPSEKTSVVGPSGSITQEKYAQSTSNSADDFYGIAEINHVTGKPVLVQYKKPVSVNVDLSQVYGNTPSEKTSVVGPSRSITQENYTQTTSVKSDDFYGIAKINPVTGKPVVVQYKKPVSANVDVSQVYVNLPSENISILGPSGSIIQEKYLPSVSSVKSDEVYGIVKNNPVTGKPVLALYEKPVFDVRQVSINTPSEKTRVVGPSGSITQEKYAQSTSINANDIFGIVESNHVTGKPVVTQYKKPVSLNVHIPQVYFNTPSEKTSITGPSGSITQEKYLQPTPFGEYNNVYSVVENNLVTEKPVAVKYLKPVFGNVAVAHGYNVVSTPSEKTSVVGPSGSITQEKYFQSSPTGKYNEIYGVVNNIPVTEKPVIVHYLEPAYGNVAVAQGYHVLNKASEKTSVVGSSGSITQEKYYTPSNIYDQAFKHYNTKIFSASPYSNSATVLYKTIPYVNNVAVVSGNQVTKKPVSYNNVNSEYLIQYGTPLNKIIALAYGLDNSVENATTEKSKTNTDQVTQVQDVHYPDIEKYPNVAAPDC